MTLTAHSRYVGPVPSTIWPLLEHAWEVGISLQSDFARSYALELSLAASMGWVSTIGPDGSSFSKVWRITASGLIALENKEHFPTC